MVVVVVCVCVGGGLGGVSVEEMTATEKTERFESQNVGKGLKIHTKLIQLHFFLCGPILPPPCCFYPFGCTLLNKQS